VHQLPLLPIRVISSPKLCVFNNQNPLLGLLDGGGAKPGAVEWLRGECEKFNTGELSTTRRRLDLMNMTEFVQWVNSTFR